MKKGYEFESECEDLLLSLTGQNKSTPLLKADGSINRSFRVPGSGAMAALKGDVLSVIPWLPRQLKIECKARREETKTDGQIITVEMLWITKNEEEAKADNQLPVLAFSFKGATRGRVWIILDTLSFFQLLNMPVDSITYVDVQKAVSLPRPKLNRKSQVVFKLIRTVLVDLYGRCESNKVGTFEVYGRRFGIIPKELFQKLLSKESQNAGS